VGLLGAILGAVTPEPAAEQDSESATCPAERTFVPLTREHLDHLADLADRDHQAFTRPAGRPEYRDRRLLTVLAQGAARHYLDCLADCDPGSRTGVKDLDVWTFYAAIPGVTFPAAKRETHVDFGPSSWDAWDLRPGLRAQRPRAIPLEPVGLLPGSPRRLPHARPARSARCLVFRRDSCSPGVASPRRGGHPSEETVRLVSGAEGHGDTGHTITARPDPLARRRQPPGTGASTEPEKMTARPCTATMLGWGHATASDLLFMLVQNTTCCRATRCHRGVSAADPARRADHPGMNGSNDERWCLNLQILSTRHVA
jgi:hypothetical protein